MREKRFTTTFAVKDFKNDPLLVLDGEDYPAVGSLITDAERRCVLNDMAGLSVRWQCDAKALATVLTLQELGRTGLSIHVGSLFIWSKDHKSNYGFAYNPPLEFHCWVQDIKGGIIDFALPGVIMVGLETRDHIGPMITGRNPFILAGTPPDFLLYKSAI